MQAVLDSISSFFSLLWYIITNMGLVDVLDILVITYLIYKCIAFFRESRGGQLIKGIVLLLCMAVLARLLGMVSVNWLITKAMDSILIIAIVIFQPELRRALERVGNSQLGFNGRGSSARLDDTEKLIQATCTAAMAMQEQKCGALMVFERKTQLGEIISTGTVIDAKPTSQLICNVFYPKSPLHDGGMVLRDGRVYAAGCILPLTPSNELNKALGTRHRAAVGMSENSDAVVVVVSEETGTVSVACNGELKRDFDAITLHTELTALLNQQSGEKNTGFFAKLAEKRKGKEPKKPFVQTKNKKAEKGETQHENKK